MNTSTGQPSVKPDVQNEKPSAYDAGIRTTVVLCIRSGGAEGAAARAGKKRFTRVVASGTNQRIGFYRALNPDCSASGNVSIRVTKQPEHGSAETVTAMDFPNYPKENIRSKCNDHKVRGMQVNYRSAEKYVGSDELELLVLYPAGYAWEVHYDVDVR